MTKRTRDKRQQLEGRRTNLERSLWQAEQAVAFVNHAVNNNAYEDEKILRTKRLLSRQLKKLKRVNPGVSLSAGELEFRLDLYFQHFVGPELHSNLETVIKQILGDVKVRYRNLLEVVERLFYLSLSPSLTVLHRISTGI